MIITDKFVYIHMPKTGGSFVTDALFQLYDFKWNKWEHIKLATFQQRKKKASNGWIAITAGKHFGCSKIPDEYSNLPILTTIRNPFDYYVSQYEFGWWKRKQWFKYYQALPGFNDRYKDFPNLSFRQFMQLMCEAFNPPGARDLEDDNTPGRYSFEFINMYFKDPQSCYPKISENYASSEEIQQDMFKVHFIFTRYLNDQLHEYLLDAGYPEEDISFITTKEKVLPLGKGRSKTQKWQQYYDAELLELVAKKDAFLFRLFEHSFAVA